MELFLTLKVLKAYIVFVLSEGATKADFNILNVFFSQALALCTTTAINQNLFSETLLHHWL